MGNSYVASNSLHNLVDGVMNVRHSQPMFQPSLEEECAFPSTGVMLPLQATNGILRSITAIGIG